jgi:hypothetical protein
MQWKIGCATFCLAGAFLYAEDEGYWDFLTDFVYMQRYSDQDQTLSFDGSRCKNSCPKGAKLNTQNLVSGFGFEPGYHVALSYVQDMHSLYEAGFLYVWDWSDTKTQVSDSSSLIGPFHDRSFTQAFDGALEMQAYYRSFFYTAELNYERVFSDQRDSFLSLSGIGGFRFANLSEKFSLTAIQESSFGEYDISTKNDLIGVQLGFDFHINAIKNLHWDLMGKAGVGLNRMSATAFLGDQSNTVELRHFNQQNWKSNIFAEASAGAGYRPLSRLDIHIGYGMLYFCGLALAPNQIDKSSNTTEFHMSRNGYVIVHGIYAGISFSI